jgi:hypothetical protein
VVPCPQAAVAANNINADVNRISRMNPLVIAEASAFESPTLNVQKKDDEGGAPKSKWAPTTTYKDVSPKQVFRKLDAPVAGTIESFSGDINVRIRLYVALR